VSTLLLVSAIVMLALSLITGLMALIGARKIRDLAPLLEESEREEGAGPSAASGLPSLSVVMTVRDEEETIEAAARSFLRQRYPGLEVVVVDDRSSDATGSILDRLAADPALPADRLTVVKVRDLPPGWLGKTNACHTGARRARGEWILFTDGDVSLGDDDLLARVLAFARRERFDHVAVVPDLRPMNPLHAGVVSCFGQMFAVGCRAYEMDRDRPRGGGGVGAFNLMTRRAYDRVGGHTLLRMDVVDDFKLGRLLKESGARQRMFNGLGLVLCPWHRGALQVVRGLEKNMFAAFEFSLPLVVALSLVGLVLTLGPFLIGLVVQAGRQPGLSPLVVAGWIPFACQVGFILQAYREASRNFGQHPLVMTLLYPVSYLLLWAAIWNSTAATLRHGGVNWRGTFYPLSALRRGVVRSGAGRRFRGN
jgi:glycosyltransferase involved in cell wall biosynthesis